MNVNKVNTQQTAFMAKTKDNNSYDKVYGGKLIGTAAATAYVTHAVARPLNDIAEIHKQFPKFGKLSDPIMDMIEKKVIKNASRDSYKLIGKIAAIGLLPLGVGVAIDSLINHHRAKKADKEAE